MAESVSQRVTRLLAGSVHAILDSIEDAAPEAVMGQAIREVDQAVDEVRADLGKVEAAKHLLMSQIARLNNEHVELQKQAEFALDGGREDLARAAVEKQDNIEAQLPVLEKSLADQKAKGVELEGYITALLAKKREMEEALNEFLATRKPSADATEATPGGAQARAEKAGAAFDRIMARQTGVSGLSASTAGDASKLKELAEMQRSHRVDQKLAALKVARGTKS